jgi:hypothetical protein
MNWVYILVSLLPIKAQEPVEVRQLYNADGVTVGELADEIRVWILHDFTKLEVVRSTLRAVACGHLIEVYTIFNFPNPPGIPHFEFRFII